MTWSISYWDLLNNDCPNQARIKTSKKQEENGNTWGPQRSREGSLEESKQHFFEASTALDTLRHTKKNNFWIHDGTVREDGYIYETEKIKCYPPSCLRVCAPFSAVTRLVTRIIAWWETRIIDNQMIACNLKKPWIPSSQKMRLSHRFLDNWQLPAYLHPGHGSIWSRKGFELN